MQSKNIVKKLKDKLAKIEAALDNCRTSVLEDGWQTMRYAKKSRKWDYYAQEKMKLIQQIEEATIQSREKCPVNLICQCPKVKGWDGVCLMS